MLRHSSWHLASQVITMAMASATAIVLARTLGVRDFGLLALLTTYAGTVNQLVDSRVWEAATRYLVEFDESGEREKAGSLIKLCHLIDIATGLLAFILVAVTAPWAAATFMHDDVNAPWLLRLFACTLLLSVPTGTSTATLRVAGRFDWLALHAVAAAVVRAVAVIAMVFAGMGLFGVVLAHVVTTGASSAVLVFLTRRVTWSRYALSWQRARLGALRDEWPRIKSFLFVTNLNAGLKLLQRQADVLLTGWFLGPSAAGVLRVAKTVSDVANVPVSAVYTAVYPECARLWAQQDRAALRQVVVRVAVLGLAGGTLVTVTMAIAADPFVSFVFGTAYRPAAAVLPWFALAMTIAAATSVWHPIVIAGDGAWASLRALASGVVVQLVMLAWLLPRSGLIGAGIAFLLFYVVWAGIMGTTTRKLLS